MTITGLIKLFPMTTGNTMNCDRTFLDRLMISQSCQEVGDIQRSDYIIAFVPVHSRAGTNVQEAMQRIPKTKDVILVVLHHTFDVNYLPPDSRRLFSEDSPVFVVDCLFHEDTGLLNCLHNDEAIRAVKQHLGISSQVSGATSRSKHQNSHISLPIDNKFSERSPLWPSATYNIKWCIICGVVAVYVLLFGFYIEGKTVPKNIYTAVFGSIYKSDQMFMENLKSIVYLKEVTQKDKCDVIMAFVQNRSQGGKDIRDALQTIPTTQPAVLVVMHQTNESQFVPEDSKPYARNKNLFAVDVLYNENQGLLTCKQNDEALKEVANHLITKRSFWSLTASKLEAAIIWWVVAVILIVIFYYHIKSVPSKIYNMLLGDVKASNHMFMKRLKSNMDITEVTSVTDCDVIVAFVPIRSRAGTDIQNALTKIPSSHPVVLVVMHHTFEADYLPPDSRLSVTHKDVFAVDCLFHESEGLLRSARNDTAVEDVRKHLNEERNVSSHNAFWSKALLFIILLSILLFVLDIGTDVFAALYLLMLLALVGWFVHHCQNSKRRLE